MIGIVAFWDQKIGLEPKGKRFLYQCYDYVARAFGAEMVFVDIDNHINFNPPEKIFTNLEDAIKYFGNEYTPVFVHPSGDKKIGKDFVHPDNALYIIGPDYGPLEIPEMENKEMVSIDVPNPIMELGAHIALTIVINDRFNGVVI